MKISKRLIYIGPQLSDKKVMPYQVFIGGIPNYLAETIKENPWMEKLFVPIQDFTEKKAEVSKKGNPLFMYYEKAKEV